MLCILPLWLLCLKYTWSCTCRLHLLGKSPLPLSSTLQKSKFETECRLPDSHFHYCLLRPQIQYIYVTSSRVYINTSQHTINHFFPASTFVREVYAPDLVETTCNSFLSWAQSLMGQTQQWHRWAISRVLIITRVCTREIQRTCVRAHLLLLKVYIFFFYTKQYKQQNMQCQQFYPKVKRGYESSNNCKTLCEEKFASFYLPKC